MFDLYTFCLVLLILINLLVSGSSRIRYCINCVALQGLLIGAIPLLAHHADASTWAMALAAVIIKSIILPLLLLRVLRRAEINREVEPFISFTFSLLISAGLLAAAVAISNRMPLNVSEGVNPLALPTAIFTIFTGLLLIISRRKALTQVIGFLMFENGVFLFGGALLVSHNLLVELGVLLDVFVLVFIMGIAVFRISSEFNHIDTDQLNTLSDQRDN